MEDGKDAFYVVRKGDIVGVYRSFSECQEQAGSSHQTSSSQGTILDKLFPSKRLHEMSKVENHGRDALDTVASSPPRKQLKIDNGMSSRVVPSDHESCTIEFYGASKGNPGKAGSGAVIRALDGTVIFFLREGVGIATNNVAEYRGLILGLKSALAKEFRHVQVRGDSMLVCKQVQDEWKVKDSKMAALCKQAKELKSQFKSFHLQHIYRESNSEADSQANRAINLADGQTKETPGDK